MGFAFTFSMCPGVIFATRLFLTNVIEKGCGRTANGSNPGEAGSGSKPAFPNPHEIA